MRSHQRFLYAKIPRAGEMAWRLRVFPILTEDLGFMTAYNYRFRDLSPPSTSNGSWRHVVHINHSGTHTYM